MIGALLCELEGMELDHSDGLAQVLSLDALASLMVALWTQDVAQVMFLSLDSPYDCNWFLLESIHLMFQQTCSPFFTFFSLPFPLNRPAGSSLHRISSSSSSVQVLRGSQASNSGEMLGDAGGNSTWPMSSSSSVLGPSIITWSLSAPSITSRPIAS